MRHRHRENEKDGRQPVCVQSVFINSICPAQTGESRDELGVAC